jgi:hypothetical protein
MVGYSEVGYHVFRILWAIVCQIPGIVRFGETGQCGSRPIIHSFFNHPEYTWFDAARVRQMCASLASQGGNSMARKVGQIIARGDRRWLIRVYLGRDHETKKRNYHNRTIHGSMREAQAYLTRKLGERDLGRDLEGAKITLNEYLDRWLKTAVEPRVRPKTFVT